MTENMGNRVISLMTPENSKTERSKFRSHFLGSAARIISNSSSITVLKAILHTISRENGSKMNTSAVEPGLKSAEGSGSWRPDSKLL